MKKALVVCDAKVLRDMTAKVLALFDCETVTASHSEAFLKFLEEEPQAVIIWDYAEERGGESTGRATYNDIKSSASSEQKIVRCGFETHNDYADYVRAPFRLEEIMQKIS